MSMQDHSPQHGREGAPGQTDACSLHTDGLSPLQAVGTLVPALPGQVNSGILSELPACLPGVCAPAVCRGKQANLEFEIGDGASSGAAC